MNIKQNIESRIVSALQAGMNKNNGEAFVGLVMMEIAAERVGMKGASARAQRIMSKLIDRSAEDVLNTLLPSQRVTAGLSMESQVLLSAAVEALSAEIQAD